MTIIGSDGGLLEAPLTQAAFAIFNGERFDVVIDFSRYPVGSSVVLRNTRAGDDGRPFPYPLPEVMRFDIVRSEPDPSDVPPRLVPVERLQPEDATKTRRFVLDFTDGHWTINGLMFDPARIDADPRLGTTEIWEFENRSDQAHDVHLHLVQFQTLAVGIQLPAPIRRGWKDTQRVSPHETISVVVRFDGYPGVYAFHCHMLEHAEHMMMGQFEVLSSEGFAASAPVAGSPLICPLPPST
jgi:spore coat protein A